MATTPTVQAMKDARTAIMAGTGTREEALAAVRANGHPVYRAEVIVDGWLKVRSTTLCGRCGGSGQYGHHGTCWDCGGKGTA